MTGTRKKKVINRFELQPMGSVTCGWWCLAAARAFEHMSMAEFIANFNMGDFKANDKELASLF